jgi:T1SS-143 domain-containing protein
MTDSTGILSEAHSSSSANEPTETQLAQAGDQVQVSEPAVGTTIQLVGAGDGLQLNFDPANVAKVEVKDGNLEVTFKNGAVAVVQGYEEWAAAGGQPTGPQGGAVDVVQLGQAAQPEQSTAADGQAPACEIPNANVVDVPVPAAGERLTLAVAPGDALRLACSFRDVRGAEVGDNLEMTFPGGGVVVVENFSAWIAAQGATITDCVCGGVNPADFIIALSLNPEDVLPAAGGGPGGPLPADSPQFDPGPGPEILQGFDHPHILPPTALGYGLPEPDRGFFPDEDDDLGGPLAQDDPPDAIRDVLTVRESTRPLSVLALAAASGDGDAGGTGDDHDGCAPPIGPQEFQPDQTTFLVITNDTFGPDGAGDPPITAFHYNGDPSLVDNPDGVLVLDPEGDKLVITSSSLDPDANQWHAEMIINGPNAGQFTFFLDSTYEHEDGQGVNHAFESFFYTIQDHDGDKASANVTVDIVDSVPIANNDCEICFTEPGVDADVITLITGNVMDNDDKGADQFLPEGTTLISFTYTAADGEGNPIQATANAGETVTTLIGGTLTVNEDGSWTYTPPASVDNSQGDVHDDFSYTIRDGDGDTSSATQPICIQDGAEPEAFDNKQCVNEGATQNVLIIADVSGSMDDTDIDPVKDGTQTRLDLEKESLTALVDKYAALDGTVTLTLIAFASGEDPNESGGDDTDGARNLGTFTFSSTTDQGYLDAIAAINNLAIKMDGLQTETEYDDALILAQQVLTDQLLTQTDGTTNTVYFLSDGDPNPDNNDAAATGWQSFVNSKDIEVVAVGIGKDVSAAELDEVEDGGDKAVIVDDSGDLAGLLTNTATNAAVSGNVLLDPTEEPNISPANDPVDSVDDFGADSPDDPAIIDLVVDGVHYNKDTAEGGDVLDNDGAGTLTIQTDLGGVLVFNFETGDYTYTAPDVVDHGDKNEVDERFTYTIQDTDGDTDPADLVICIKDNVEPPEVTMAIGVEGNGACVEEDSKLGDLDNRVDVHAEAQADDTLTQLVITGFNNPDWTFDFNGLKGAGVDLGLSEFDTVDGKITLVFNAGVKVFDGSFFVQPPADSDVDLGTLTATATAAAAGDPTDTLDSSTNLNVTVDANANPVDITTFVVSDTGGDGSFSPNETGTLHIAATFGDSLDGSETHTVVVTVPSVFDVTNPAGGVVTNNPDGSHTITFTLNTTGGSNNFSADVGVKATNGIAPQDYEFEATATATETTTGDTECDTSPLDNVASDTASDTVQGADDKPIAYDNEQCVTEGATQNVVIIADVSGSMDDVDIDPVKDGKQTRLELEKESLTALVDKYAELDGTVTITLIAFASGEDPNESGGDDTDGARNLGTFTFSNTTDQGYLDAIAAIDSLAIKMDGLQTETEYDDALILAQQVLADQLLTQADGTTNTVYFLSDGDPNPDDNDAAATGWQSFVNSKNVEVVAVGIGKDVSATELDEVEDGGDKAVIVDDSGDLAGLLTNTAANASVSGNVLLDPTEEPNISPANDPVGSVDDFGDNLAGTPKIVSLQHDGHTYDLTDVVGGEGGTVLDVDGTEITILTDLGGTLKFDFETGDYTYTSPDKVDHTGKDEVEERFTYTIQDKDGDTDPADLVICIKDNVEPPEVTLAIGVDGKGGCVEEDSKLGDLDNQVAVHAEAQADDTLTQLVITGFNNEPGWSFDLEGLKTAGVDVGASDFIATDGQITLVFNPGVKVFDGSFFVQPPANSDVDLGTLTATATAAAAGDPTQTLDSSANLDVTVDANADPVTVTIDVNDSGDAGATFQTGEAGTLAIGATFGDTGDGSEDHSVLVTIPDGFTATLTNPLPAGVTALVNLDGNIEFTVANSVASFNYVITVTNTSAAEGNYVFSATSRAEETNTGDVECAPDLVEGENVATQTKNDSTTVTTVDAPNVNLALANGGACVEEDSVLGDPSNVVNVSTAAQPGDALTQLVITGFNNQPGWSFNFDTLDDGANAAKVQGVSFNATTGTLTILFNAGVTSFDGSFSVQPPANSDVDLGTLTATATAADGVDPTQTASASDSEEVHVDANADPVSVTLNVNDSGDAGTTFQQNEVGTVQVVASFGDFQDGSEIHTVLVDVPAGFTVGALDGLPAGVTAQVVDGNNVLFTVVQGTSGFDYTFNVTNTGGSGPAVFTATATANENPPSDIECDPSDADNIKTQVATENEQTQDDTPLINPVPVTVDDDDTPGFNGGPTDTIDPPNASATASLGASFGVDAPGTVVFGVNANPSVTSHGDAITYTLSGDSKTLTAVADAGGPDQRDVYTVTINGDGTYTFTLIDALDHALGGGENDLGLSFNVIATDKDLDSTNGVINVTVNDDSPISTGGATGTVEEDNLPGGIDENADINLTTSGSFGINFGADGPGDISSITGPAGLFSGGDPVTYSFNPATNTLTGSAGGSPVFTVTLNPETGQYTFTLSGPLDQAPGGGDEQALSLNFGFTATDFDDDPVDGGFTVNVRDDVPVAGDNIVNTTADQTVNIMIIFDRSGSMDENPNMDGYSSRIDLARAAVAALLETYGSFADQVNVKIVDFSSTATSTGWMTIEQANAYLAGLEPDGNTNYADALDEAASTFNTGLPEADRNLVYFLSDGKPTDSGGSPDSLSPAEIATWENFAKNDANNIEQVFAIGIGGDIPPNDPDLEAVALKDTNNDGVDETPSSVVVSDEGLLLSTLVSTVANVVNGNVINDTTADKFGADGEGSPKITTIQIGVDTYAYDGEDITKNGVLFANNTAVLAVATGLLGAFLTFDFSDGDFTYKAPDSDTDQTFVYTIVDADGDTDTGNLTFLNTAISDQPTNQEFGDAGANNLVGDTNPNTKIDIMGGDDGNDTLSGLLGNDHITGGAGADNLLGGDGNDVIIGGTTSEVVDSNTIRAADGNDTIDGGKGNDYLFGNDGADTIHGGEGADFIVGGINGGADGSAGAPDLGDVLFGDAGNDTIVGGNGDDSVTGGEGNDTINVVEDNDVVFYTDKLDGHDVIQNFDGDASGGQDILDLNQLFDSLNVATNLRDDRTNIVDNGATVDVQVDVDNNGSFELTVATLNTTNTITEGTDVVFGTL